MKKLIVLALAGVFLVAYAGCAHAADAQLSVAGSASWTYDFNSPDNGAFFGFGTNQQSYPNAGSGEATAEQVNIDLVELHLMGSASDNVDYEAALWFGDLAPVSGDCSTDTGGDVDCNDVGLYLANATFPVGPLDVTVGRYATNIGYESAQPWNNAHISRSLAFLAQPINHDGVNVAYDAGNWWGSVGVVNQYTVSDVGFSDGDYNKGVTGDLGLQAGDWTLDVAGIFDTVKGVASPSGEADLVDVSFVAEGQVGNVPLAFEYNYQDFETGATVLALPLTGDVEADSFALYSGMEWGEWGINGRVEYNDIDAGAGAGFVDGEIWSVTVTGSRELAPGVEARIEYRHNESDGFLAGDAIFADDSAGGLDDSQDVVSLQVIVY